MQRRNERAEQLITQTKYSLLLRAYLLRSRSLRNGRRGNALILQSSASSPGLMTTSVFRAPFHPRLRFSLPRFNGKCGNVRSCRDVVTVIGGAFAGKCSGLADPVCAT